MEHYLKTLPEYFDSAISGAKPFEVRKDDRSFAVGDTLVLQEWKDSVYTNRVYRCEVTYILRDDYCREGYCIMGVRPEGRQPRQAAHWIEYGDGSYTCSCCRRRLSSAAVGFPFAPCCGAKIS